MKQRFCLFSVFSVFLDKTPVAPAQAGAQVACGGKLGPGLRRDDGCRDSSVTPDRRARASLALWFILLFSLALSSCGFRLRGSQQLPFDTIFLGFGANSPLGSELARNIRAGTNTRVVDSVKEAQAVLDVLGEARDREVLSVNAQGRAREFTLRHRLTFRLHDGKGSEFLGATAVEVHRDLAFDDVQALAFEAESVLLYRDMQTDLVQQILRRLAAAKGVR